jgi:hypothetical protein
MTHIRRCPLLAAHRRIPRRLILHPILHRLEDYETRAADCLLFIGEQRLGNATHHVDHAPLELW